MGPGAMGPVKGGVRCSRDEEGDQEPWVHEKHGGVREGLGQGGEYAEREGRMGGAGCVGGGGRGGEATCLGWGAMGPGAMGP